MLKLFLLLASCGCISFVTSWRGLMLGSGQWLVLNVMLCDNPEQYDMKYNVSRKKVNRTHDCFSIDINLQREFNNSMGMQIDVYQLVDGGFKFFQTIADNCACKFLMRHARENVVRALTLAKVNPTRCPIRPAEVHMHDFVMDYRQLAKHGVYGTFMAVVKFTYEGGVILCLKCILNFDERNGLNSEEDEDDIPDAHVL